MVKGGRRFGGWVALVAVVLAGSLSLAFALYCALADSQTGQQGRWITYAFVSLGLAIGWTALGSVRLAKLRPKLGVQALPVVVMLEFLGLVLVWLVFEVTIV